MVCNDICKRHYKDKKNVQHNWVTKGYVKCVTCSFTIKTTDIRCKCCGYRFRKSVRNSNSLKYYYTVSRPRKVLENGYVETRTRQQQPPHKEKKRI